MLARALAPVCGWVAMLMASACAGATLPSAVPMTIGPARLVALAQRIDALCPARALPAILEGDPLRVECPAEVGVLDAELDQGLRRSSVLVTSPADRVLVRPPCVGPTERGMELAVLTAQRIQETRDRCATLGRCSPRRDVIRGALLRYHLRLARDAQWTRTEHEIIDAGSDASGLGWPRWGAMHGERNAPYATLLCRVETPSAWEQPETWVTRTLAASSATMHGPPSAHWSVRHPGVRLGVVSFRGSLEDLHDALLDEGLEPRAWPSAEAPRGELYMAPDRIVTVWPGRDEQLLVHASTAPSAPMDAVLRALASVQWDGETPAVTNAPILVDDPTLRWTAHEAGEWSWSDEPPFDRTPLVSAWTIDTPTTCDAAPIMLLEGGGWADACDAPWAESGTRLHRVVPTSSGHIELTIHVPVTESLDAESSMVRALTLRATTIVRRDLVPVPALGASSR